METLGLPPTEFVTEGIWLTIPLGKRENVTISFSPTHPTQRFLGICPAPEADLGRARIEADAFLAAVSRRWSVPFPFPKGPCGRIQMDFMAVETTGLQMSWRALWAAS